MSRPVPSPSMNGMIGWSGTVSLPFLIEIFWPPGGATGLGEVGVGLVISAHASTARCARCIARIARLCTAPWQRHRPQTASGCRLNSSLTHAPGVSRPPFINEGGAIHVDGQGTVLVTEQCLLNRNRNPTLSRAQIEAQLRRYLGVCCVIWLGKGVIADETSGHIDNLACFARPGEVCLTWCADPHDPQHRVSQDAFERLMAARDARGRRLKVHKLPSPGPLFITRRESAGIGRGRRIRSLAAGLRLAGSYVNFYLANGALVLPLLDERTDAAARRALRRIFPRRRIIGVGAREILLGGGNIHCITQQQPARHRKRPPP